MSIAVLIATHNASSFIGETMDSLSNPLQIGALNGSFDPTRGQLFRWLESLNPLQIGAFDGFKPSLQTKGCYFTSG